MQFVEKNSYDLRVAVYRLRRRGSSLEFLLTPMIHIGSQSYYDEVHRRLSACDLILTEGVRSRKIMPLLSYHILDVAGKLGLVTQKDALDLSELRDKIVGTDMDGGTFDDKWTDLPLLHRALTAVLAPAFFAYAKIWGDREFVAQHLAVEDLPSSDDVLMQNENTDRFNDLIVAERDRVVIDKIRRLHETGGADKQLVGIPYGAGHMPGICGFL
ncbi:MAG TPA: hypothetical protein VI756_01595, partial [Blastocatellia bacterium]